MPFRAHHQLIPVRKPASHALSLLSKQAEFRMQANCKQYVRKQTRYFRVLRINQPERSPKRLFSPHRLCTLSSKHGKPCSEGSGPDDSRIPSRPKWTRWSTLKQWCLFRVLRTYMVIYTCCQVVDYTLMMLAIPSKLSRLRLASYWLDAPPLTFTRRRKSAYNL